MIGKRIEAYVLAYDEKKIDLQPVLWITAYPPPYENKVLELVRK